jgi:hypothetical protein
MNNKINAFAALLENDKIDDLIRSNMTCAANIANQRVIVRPKNKYTCVDVGGSGTYMVDNATGEIFGIKGYGIPNKRQCFGTLETIYDYYWGLYRAIPSKTTRQPEELKSVVNVLSSQGIYIDEQGRLYGGTYGPKKEPEPPKKVKEFGSDRYAELTADFKAAAAMAREAAEQVSDGGTCNLDGVYLRLPGFQEDKTVEAISEAGLSGFLHNHAYYGKGYLICPPCVGQADK